MPRNIVQDVLPPERRSIRNIPLPSRRISDISNSTVEKREEGGSDITEENEIAPPKRPRITPRFMIWAIAIVCIIGVFFAAASFFVSADIHITPKQQKIPLNNTTVTAVKGDGGDSALSYQVITLTQAKGKEVASSGSEEVSTKATGSIVIYNNFSSSPQKLIKNTRFETPNGLIYRISDAITVPGTSIKDGKVIPGSISTQVLADMAGEKYNISLSDFTIPGFKGDKRYTEIYARTKTAIEGGFNGTKKVVSRVDLAKATSSIESELKTILIQKARGQIPKGFILYDDAMFFAFSLLPQTDSSGQDTSTTINEQGTLYAILLNESDLTKSIVEKMISSVPTGSIELVGIDKLEFKVTSVDWKPTLSTPLVFTLKGDVLAVWLYDESEVKKALAGKSRKDLDQIMEAFPSIVGAKVILRPIWKTSFPENLGKINLRRILKN